MKIIKVLSVVICLIFIADAWKSTLKRSVASIAIGSSLFGGLTPALAAPLGSVVVIGASGKTGSQIVSILAKQGVAVQPAYARETANKFEGVSNIYPPIVADVTSPESLSSALSGAKSVIFAASASGKGGNAEKVDYKGVENTAKAAIDLKIPQLVMISSGAVTRPDSIGYKITNIFGGIMGYKIMGENAMRSAYETAGDEKLSYAIIRPGGLLDNRAAGVREIELNQGDSIAGEINRADVAECAAAAAISKTIPNRVTFEISEVGRSAVLEGRFKQPSGYEQSGKDSYDELFKGLKNNINKL